MEEVGSPGDLRDLENSAMETFGDMMIKDILKEVHHVLTVKDIKILKKLIKGHSLWKIWTRFFYIKGDIVRDGEIIQEIQDMQKQHISKDVLIVCNITKRIK